MWGRGGGGAGGTRGSYLARGLIRFKRYFGLNIFYFKENGLPTSLKLTSGFRKLYQTKTQENINIHTHSCTFNGDILYKYQVIRNTSYQAWPIAW